MALWEQILLGIGAFILVLFFWPGAKTMMERRQRSGKPGLERGLNSHWRRGFVCYFIDPHGPRIMIMTA